MMLPAPATSLVSGTPSFLLARQHLEKVIQEDIWSLKKWYEEIIDQWQVPGEVLSEWEFRASFWHDYTTYQTN